ncbi:histidine kinase [Echinicola strongylocentroti]|uniref:Histidine kinase n=1 Tax=Echinicola strongylocentroti TaxID=1795355 RepID=A0A2Z4IDV0_9BACT|nr:histidine kinase [Echinicola strongylocentroti]AWW29232.1 histidine kinase [Echinicola strongylocentroti]
MDIKEYFNQKKWLILIAAATTIPVLVLFTVGENNYAAALLWIIAVLGLLVWGNIQVHQLLEKWHPWGRLPLRRFLIQFLISGLYSLACINLCYYLLKTLFIGLPPDAEQMLLLNIYGLLFYIPVMSINFGVYFMQRWKKAALRSEQLQAENLKSRLESLKVHVDPHFLFNNLNVLSSLIDIDTEDAHRFLNKFAEVYRYVLQHRDEELVELDTEIEFIHSYIYLFQKRLNRQLKITIDYPPSSTIFHIPTLAVQMLLENAIKHNIATVSKPLTILIFMEDARYIVVQNTYQPKNQQYSSLPKTGLDNIMKRLAYFSDEEMVIEQTTDKFTVKLPLLVVDSKRKDIQHN